MFAHRFYSLNVNTPSITTCFATFKCCYQSINISFHQMNSMSSLRVIIIFLCKPKSCVCISTHRRFQTIILTCFMSRPICICLYQLNYREFQRYISHIRFSFYDNIHQYPMEKRPLQNIDDYSFLSSFFKVITAPSFFHQNVLYMCLRVSSNKKSLLLDLFLALYVIYIMSRVFFP